MKTNHPILLIEDDEVDQMTVQRALKEIHVVNPLIIANNGEEGIEHLQDSSHARPGLILLDLNMPRMNGVEFLKIAKSNEDFKRIPVVVLTTSVQEQDKIDSFNLGVSGYMVKPVDYHQFVEVVKTINLYWTLSEIPM